MKKIFLSLVVLSLVSFTTFAQENRHNFSTETGKFSVDFIGDISESARITETSSSFKTTISDGRMRYMVSSTKHNSNLESDIEKLLNTSVDSFMENIKGEIISKEEVTRDNVKGMYVDIAMSEGAVRLEYFVFLRGFYQYQVMAYAPVEVYDAENASRFFKGFKILE
ncbi:MAG: hypothetical protein COB73_01865 [Flavobacteriaceae bacterium]|nr:MAG: hypothetical protein COB73_01865 [Flavobacteriaceae bacterium]